MNGIKSIFFTAIAVVLLLVSCMPAEQSFTQEAYKSYIFTVNKATLKPEFEDTLYRVSNNPWDFGLETGDRAHILLHFYYDAYSGKKPDWEITEVYEIIPTRTIVARDSFDTTGYDLPFTSRTPYEVSDHYLHADWIWENRLNVNMTFKAVPDSTQFAMVFDGVSGDTVRLNLMAKTMRPSGKKVSKLLTYDLNGIADMLTDTEKGKLKNYETLKVRVNAQYLDMKDSVFNYSFNVRNGEFVNPLHD
jgi:hypothetical protein